MKISNDLENGLVLNLHCQSKNNDLGVHALSKGGTFEFVFRPIIGALHYHVDGHRCKHDCSCKRGWPLSLQS